MHPQLPLIQEIAKDFWRHFGKPSFPRNLERAIALKLPVAVIKLPALTVLEANNWLQTRSFGELALPKKSYKDTPLCGALVALGGRGLIFIDGRDPEDEQLWTLAHELAHFLVDYLKPRQYALAKMGTDFAEVLDGLRPPTESELLQAFWKEVKVGVYSDFSLKARASSSEATLTDAVEDRADVLGFHLLVSGRNVLRMASHGTWEERKKSTTNALIKHFGLPQAEATKFGVRLLIAAGKGDSWMERLKNHVVMSHFEGADGNSK